MLVYFFGGLLLIHYLCYFVLCSWLTWLGWFDYDFAVGFNSNILFALFCAITDCGLIQFASFVFGFGFMFGRVLARLVCFTFNVCLLDLWFTRDFDVGLSCLFVIGFIGRCLFVCFGLLCFGW